MSVALRLVYRVRGLVVVSLFNLLYSLFAPLYDWVAQTFFLGQWAQWQRSVIPRITKRGSILDIGCGTGTLLIELLRRGYDAYGVDRSPQMLAQARKKLSRTSGIPANSHIERLKQTDITKERLPFDDDYFSSITCTFPSQYILNPIAIKELSRVLAPGGRLVIVDSAVLVPRKDSRASRLLYRFHELVYGRQPHGGNPEKRRPLTTFDVPLTAGGFLRRDETDEDEHGATHIIIATKSW